MSGQTFFALSFAHEEVLSVGRHVETQREGKVGVDLLLHHRHHVEGVSHGVETQDAWQLFETRPVGGETKDAVRQTKIIRLCLKHENVSNCKISKRSFHRFYFST